MSTLVRLEFYKCRRRQISLICAGLLGAELVWFGVYLTRQDPEDLLQGWMLTLNVWCNLLIFFCNFFFFYFVAVENCNIILS